jgi:dephospho-CoA kinase
MKFHKIKTYRVQPCVIGLTGGMGSGKSLVLRILRDKAIPVLQTDKIGHELLRDHKIIKRIVRKYGKEILDGSDRIDRKALAKVAFRSLQGQKHINKILHPLISRSIEKWVLKQSKKRKPKIILVVEVPLLFEAGYDRLFDRTLCLSSPKGMRTKRLLKLGWTREEIKQRENLQWPQNKKNQRADWVIFNTGSPGELSYTIQRWLRKTAFTQGLKRPNDGSK